MSALRKGMLEIVSFPSRPRLAFSNGMLPPSDPPPPEGPRLIHPGEIISRRFLDEQRTPEWLAGHIGKSEVHALLDGKLKIGVDLSRDLSYAFKMSAMFFMNLQHRYDQDVVRKEIQAPTP